MKVGDYVRFYNISWTEIGQIAGEVEDSHLKVVKCRDGYYDLGNFIKSSPNIIDLIEVGDYVNGKYVDKYQGKLGVFCELPNGKWEFIELTNEHYLISSIVTKEMYSSVEYKIGE